MIAPKRILITGASKGIGFALTKRLLSQGHSVIAVSRSTTDLELLAQKNDHLAVIRMDITEDLSPLVEHAKNLKIDHVVNNAGYLVNKSILDHSDEEIFNQFKVNVIAPMRIVRHLIPYLSDDASVCNISSMGGVQGSAKFPGLAAYSSSKGALSILSECMAEELKERNIRCNALALGAVQTEMLESAFPGYEAPIQAAEMAEYIAEFVTVTSRFYNGKILPVSVSTP
ncbi:SDR family NAD(P)-dependent oxidoreductase [Parvicella tangerina]|uniref:Oxidoreductase n=1 Tax=Parvicella tangerina TaxID=2829795 RepID=A0A916JNV5_9FLAO|nr:SDR family NAD(P)-dependent oxidoreductase [Parvicella tangerina]CAG5084569.1 putative oxidoreductase [Parvicella tangerina]